MKWYLKPVVIILAILVVGPFAVPLVWMSPNIKIGYKVMISILLFLVTAWLVYASSKIYQSLMVDIADLQNALK